MTSAAALPTSAIDCILHCKCTPRGSYHQQGVYSAIDQAHCGMSEQSRTKLLEVFVDQRSASSWKWSVHFGSCILNSGFERTEAAAKFSGNAALFRILISAPGWDE